MAKNPLPFLPQGQKGSIPCTGTHAFPLITAFVLLLLSSVVAGNVSSLSTCKPSSSESGPVDGVRNDQCLHPDKAGEELSFGSSIISPENVVVADDATGAEDDGCALYLGPSSIPNAGLGMYTAVDVEKGRPLGDREIIVPIPDRRVFGGNFLVDEVTWAAELHGDFYHEGKSIDNFFPGFGAAVNYHSGLINVDHVADEQTVDSAGLHRSSDPGSGAFSYYTMSHVATTDIKAGSELFVNYGEDWFHTREETVGKVPFAKDFQTADRIVKAMATAIVRGTNWTDQMKEDIWHVVRASAEERVRMALPSKVTDVGKASIEGTARHSLPDFVRSPEWLRQNAMCVDNLYVNRSTVPQAGGGAFAKRFIPKDSILAPIPVLQISRDSLVVQSKGRPKQQLLLNYCYGNRNSSVLLVPYSPGVNLINHNGSSPNAEIRWSEYHLNKQEWLSLTASEVLQRGFGLSMEIVATRDIYPHEEVFVNYGSDWESAWARHVQEWTPPKDAEGYISAAEMTKVDSIRTEDEQISNPYANNLVTGCNYWPRANNFKKGDGAEVEHIWNEANNDCLRPCRVISREKIDGVDYYKAEMSPSHLHPDCVLPETPRHIVSRIPRSALRFIDQKYTKDQYIQGAFRHEIGIPSDIFPSSWLDIA